MHGLSRSTFGLLASGVAALILGGGLALGEGAAARATKTAAKPVLSDADLAKLIEESTKTIQAATKSASEFNRLAKNLENEGYVLAIYAQAGIGNDEMTKKAGALAEAGLALAAAAKKKDFAEAKKHATAIAGFKTMNGTAKSEDLALGKNVPLANLMAVVRDCDKELKAAQRMSAAQWNVKGKPESVHLQANKMVALGVAMVAHAPEKDPDAKKGQTRKAWLDSSQDVVSTTQELAAAAKNKKPDEFKAAYRKMDSACTKCHEPFRVESD